MIPHVKWLNSILGSENLILFPSPSPSIRLVIGRLGAKPDRLKSSFQYIAIEGYWNMCILKLVYCYIEIIQLDIYHFWILLDHKLIHEDIGCDNIGAIISHYFFSWHRTIFSFSQFRRIGWREMLQESPIFDGQKPSFPDFPSILPIHWGNI